MLHGGTAPLLHCLKRTLIQKESKRATADPHQLEGAVVGRRPVEDSSHNQRYDTNPLQELENIFKPLEDL